MENIKMTCLIVIHIQSINEYEKGHYLKEIQRITK